MGEQCSLSDHFADHFVCENVGTAMMLLGLYDVQNFDAGAILYGDTRCKKMDISMFSPCFQCDFCLNPVKYARICPLFIF